MVDIFTQARVPGFGPSGIFSAGRDAPWSVLVSNIGGDAIRLGSYDPEVLMLLKDLDRRAVVA